MILAAMMLALMQDPPTLAEIERLSPAAAGELALAGQDHGPIVSVVHRQGRGMDPPGLVSVELVERAVTHGAGCSRKRWTLAFFRRDAAALSPPVPTTEVALLRSGTCPDGEYVDMNPDMESVQAFEALRYLDEIRLPQSRVRFSCSDRTSSHLCASPRTIRRELARISPWAVMQEGNVTIMWLGVRGGGVVTEVRYRAASPGRITVRRRIPPPF